MTIIPVVNKNNQIIDAVSWRDLKEQNNPCATLEMNFPGVMNSGPNEGQTHVEIICQQYLSPQGLTLATPGEAV